MRHSVIALILLMLSCNDGQFTGSTGSTKDKAKKPDPGSETDAPFPGEESSDPEKDADKTDGEDGTSNSDGDLEVDEGGEDFSKIDNFDDFKIEEYEKKCSDAEALSDPAAKFVFDTSETVRNFVNERCKIAVPNIGAIHSGDVTAKFVCLLKGYQSANVTFKREYSSPNNNFIAHWDDVAKKFLTHGASGWNTKIHTMECTGKFKPSCSLDAVKINCQ